MKKILVILALLLVLTGCTKKDKQEEKNNNNANYSAFEVATTTQALATSTITTPEPVKEKIVYKEVIKEVPAIQPTQQPVNQPQQPAPQPIYTPPAQQPTYAPPPQNQQGYQQQQLALRLIEGNRVFALLIPETTALNNDIQNLVTDLNSILNQATAIQNQTIPMEFINGQLNQLYQTTNYYYKLSLYNEWTAERTQLLQLGNNINYSVNNNVQLSNQDRQLLANYGITTFL